MRYFLVAVAVFAGWHFSAVAAEPSPEIREILKERYDGKYDLNLEGLPESEFTKERRARLKDKGAYEVYRVPYPRGMADYFAYAIYRFTSTGEVWIVKSGGIASVLELYIVRLPQKAEPGAGARARGAGWRRQVRETHVLHYGPGGWVYGGPAGRSSFLF